MFYSIEQAGADGTLDFRFQKIKFAVLASTNVSVWAVALVPVYSRFSRVAAEQTTQQLPDDQYGSCQRLFHVPTLRVFFLYAISTPTMQ